MVVTDWSAPHQNVGQLYLCCFGAYHRAIVVMIISHGRHCRRRMHTLEVGTRFAVELCRAEIYGIARSDVDVDADGERGISVGNPLYSHGHGPGLSV